MMMNLAVAEVAEPPSPTCRPRVAPPLAPRRPLLLCREKVEAPSFDDPDDVESAGPRELLRRALGKWPRRVAVVTSFQAEGMVLLDMAWRLDPGVRVITLDTGRLPQETYDMMDRVWDRYGVDVEVFFPDAAAVEALLHGGGPNLFYDSVESRLSRCHVRKVEPLQRALSGLDAWITGLRRDQSPSRSRITKVEVDEAHGGIAKLSPLADWTWEQVDAYTRDHGVPRHPLYARGYTSIGCAPCTRPVRAGEDQRAGRWWWERSDAKECGLHPIRIGRAAVAEARP
jgi:thioredoxin-dependent adenylylsulfate APS reductase